MAEPARFAHDNAALRGMVDSLTDPNVHSVSVRDLETGQVLAIYRTEEEAARHAFDHARHGRVTELVIWHPKKCDCEVDV
jgi:hypothetical protein